MGDIKFFSEDQREKILEFNILVHNEGVVTVINNIMFKNPFNNLRDFVYLEENGKIIYKQ
jgi:hypothetical protein